MKKLFIYTSLFLILISITFAQEKAKNYSDFLFNFSRIKEPSEKLRYLINLEINISDSLKEYHLNEIYSLAVAENDQIVLAMALHAKSKLLSIKYLYDSAITLIDNAKEIFLKNHFLTELSSCYYDYASYLKKGYFFAEVKKKLDSSLLYDKKNVELQAKLQLMRADIYIFEEKLDSSNQKIQDALNKYKKSKNIKGEADCYLKLSNINIIKKEFASATKNMDRAKLIYEKIKDEEGLAKCLENDALLCKIQNKSPEAIKKYLESIVLFKRIDDLSSIGNCYLSISEILLFGNSLDSAFNFARNAIYYLESSKNILQLAKAYEVLGDIYLFKQKGNESFNEFDRSLKIFLKMNYLKGIASVYKKIGSLFSFFGVFDDAAPNYLNAIRVYHFLNDSLNEAFCQEKLAEIFFNQGKQLEAITEYENSLKIYFNLKLDNQILNITFKLADLFLNENKFEEAIKKYNDVVRLAEKYNNQLLKANCFFKIGTTYYEWQKYKESIKNIKSAKEILTPFNEKLLSVNCDFYLALIDSKTSNDKSLLVNIQKAINGFYEIRDYNSLAISYYHLGNYFMSIGDYKKSFEALSKGLEYAYKSGNIKFIKVSKISNVNILSQIYRSLVKLSYLQNNSNELFFFGNKMHDNSHIHILRNARAKVVKDVPESILQKEESITNRISSLISNLITEKDKNKISQINKLVDESEKDYEDLTNQIKRINPSFYNLNYPETMDLSTVKNKMSSKDCFIQYIVDDSLLYACAITRDTLVTFAKSIKYSELMNQVSEFSTLISKFDSVSSFISSGYNLYRMLLKPLEGVFKDKENIHIIADRDLRYLPFESLLSSETSLDSIRKWGKRSYSFLPYLIKKYNVCYQTSISNALINLANPGYWKSDSLLYFMDPIHLFEPISNAKEIVKFKISGPPFVWYLYEAFKKDSTIIIDRSKSIKEQFAMIDNFTKNVILGYERDQALEDRIKQSKFVESFKYLYLGTMGVINELNPSLSGIVFAEGNVESREDAFLNLIEIFNLKLNISLTALSQLLIGKTDSENGLGLSLFARAFEYANSKSLLLSLWDTGNSSLYFYGDLFRNIKLKGLNKITALREAKLQFLSDPEFNSPFYWSSYILYGNP